MEKRIGDVFLEIGMRGGKEWRAQAFGVEKGRVAEGFVDVEEIALAQLHFSAIEWGSVLSGGCGIHLPGVETSANVVPFGPEFCAAVGVGIVGCCEDVLFWRAGHFVV